MKTEDKNTPREVEIFRFLADKKAFFDIEMHKRYVCIKLLQGENSGVFVNIPYEEYIAQTKKILGEAEERNK